MRCVSVALFASAILLAACGQTRRYGDAGGVPVAFSVHLERPFVKAMKYNQWRPSVGAGAAVSSGGYTSTGVGVGFSFSATDVYLLGGDGPAEAQVFMKELGWGDNAFEVPLTSRRKLHLTVKAEGGREGWESLGEITVPSGEQPHVVITLDANGVKMTVTPAEKAAVPEAKTDKGPAVERTTGKPEAGSEKPEAGSGQPAADSHHDEAVPPVSSTPPTDKTPPPGESPDAGDKPPGTKDRVKVAPGPPPGTAPLSAPNSTPAKPSAATGPDAP